MLLEGGRLTAIEGQMRASADGLLGDNRCIPVKWLIRAFPLFPVEYFYTNLYSRVNAYVKQVILYAFHFMLK